MIQRIQTVYLLAISILGSLLFFLPIAQFIDVNNFSYTVNFMGIFSPEKKNCLSIPTLYHISYHYTKIVIYNYFFF